MSSQKFGVVANAPSGLSETQFHVKDQNLPIIIDVLVNKLYSHKLRAPIREYSTNAQDAHIEAGNPELPIQITLPTRQSPELKIKDLGVGLSKKEIESIYVSLGESPKRGNLDTNGTYGLGSKSAFAYVDTFNIIAVKDGIKCACAAQISSKGARLLILSEGVTNEPNGVEITLPIKSEDIKRVSHEINFVYHFFKVKPNVTNGKLEVPNGFEPYYTSEAGQLCYSNGDYARSSVDHYAKMHNVGYQIDPDYFNGYSLPNTRVILNFENGEIDFTPNRETLDYNEKTRNAIDKKIKEFFKEIDAAIKSPIEKAPTMQEALKKYKESRTQDASYINGILSYVEHDGYRLSSFPVNKFIKKEIGKTLGDDVEWKMLVKLMVSNYSYSGGKTCRMTRHEYGVTNSQSVTFVFAEEGEKLKQSKLRFLGQELYKTKGKDQYIIYIEAEKSVLDKILSIPSLTCFDWQDLADVVLPVKPKAASGATGRYADRQVASGAIKLLHKSRYFSNRSSDFWDGEVEKLQDDVMYVYTEITRTNCVNMTNEEFAALRNKINLSLDFYKDEYPELKFVGVTKGGMKTLKKSKNIIDVNEMWETMFPTVLEKAKRIKEKENKRMFWTNVESACKRKLPHNVEKFSSIKPIADLMSFIDKVRSRVQKHQLSDEESYFLKDFQRTVQLLNEQLDFCFWKKEKLVETSISNCLAKVKNHNLLAYLFIRGIINISHYEMKNESTIDEEYILEQLLKTGSQAGN